jgi:hypothetical protein
MKNVVNLSKLITYIKIRYTFKLNTRYNLLEIPISNFLSGSELLLLNS